MEGADHERCARCRKRRAGRNLGRPHRTCRGCLDRDFASLCRFRLGRRDRFRGARRQVPAEVHALPRRRRTPASIGYRPPPLRMQAAMGPVQLPEIGPLPGTAEVTLFDFAAVSLALHVPFRLPDDSLRRLADWLANADPVTQAARSALEPLYHQLRPAIQRPQWKNDLSEEYFVFQLTVQGGAAHLLCSSHTGWLAGLLHLEAGPLSSEEEAEALRLHLSYSPDDLFIPDWAAAVLVDRDCDGTLQTIEFANLQLLEYPPPRQPAGREPDGSVSNDSSAGGVPAAFLANLFAAPPPAPR